MTTSNKSRRHRLITAGVAGIALAAAMFGALGSASAIEGIDTVPSAADALATISADDGIAMAGSEDEQYGKVVGLDTSTIPSATSQTTTSSYTENVRLVEFDGGWFSMTVPEGWMVMATAAEAGTTIEVYDPADPATRIVYWGQIPFHVSQLFKDECVAWSSASPVYTFYAALPMMYNWSFAGCIDLLDDFCWNMVSYGFSYSSDAFFASNVNVTSYKPVSYLSKMYGNFILDEGIVGATVTLSDGTQCYADFIGGFGISGDPSYVGLGLMMDTYMTCAPAARYDAISPVLTQCIGTIRYSDAYVQNAIVNGQILVANSTAYFNAISAINAQATQDFCDYILDRERYILSDGSTLLVYY